MSLKANSAWLGAAAVALTMLLPAASMAQSPLQGPRQGQYNYRYDPGFAPRPDFPGAKQSNNNTMHKTSRNKHTQR
jgi:hypothetical protein